MVKRYRLINEKIEDKILNVELRIYNDAQQVMFTAGKNVIICYADEDESVWVNGKEIVSEDEN